MITLRGYIKGLMKRRAVRKGIKNRKKALSQKAIEQFSGLEKKLGYIFNDKSLLKLALTHPSTVNLANSRVLSNQRLEFLGDAVLQTIISDFVYHNLDGKQEGDLTRARIAMTHGKFLAKLAENLTIPECLILPKKLNHLREVMSAKEDAFESVIGAIYLDAGFEQTKRIVLSWYEAATVNVGEMVTTQNPKGKLQERAAKKGMKVSYRLAAQTGPDHDKKFEMEVLIDDTVYASATATSKKEAETKAAQLALEKFL